MFNFLIPFNIVCTFSCFFLFVGFLFFFLILQGDEKLDTKFKHKGTDKGNLRAHSYSKLRKIEAKLAKARYSIKEASKIQNLTSTFHDLDYVPQGPIYINANAFHRYFYIFFWSSRIKFLHQTNACLFYRDFILLVSEVLSMTTTLIVFD